VIWCGFHKITDFLCSRCVKRLFYSAFVWKCTNVCKHCFGVQLLQNPLLCSSIHEKQQNRRKMSISWKRLNRSLHKQKSGFYWRKNPGYTKSEYSNIGREKILVFAKTKMNPSLSHFHAIFCESISANNWNINFITNLCFLASFATFIDFANYIFFVLQGAILASMLSSDLLARLQGEDRSRNNSLAWSLSSSPRLHLS
jgi:hypothetical protein